LQILKKNVPQGMLTLMQPKTIETALALAPFHKEFTKQYVCKLVVWLRKVTFKFLSAVKWSGIFVYQEQGS
jgi:hypothetical protein